MLLSLIALHMRINMILCSIPNARSFYGLYASSYDIIHGQDVANFSDICSLFAQLQQKHRYFIDSFSFCTEIVSSIVRQISESVAAGADASSIRYYPHKLIPLKVPL